MHERRTNQRASVREYIKQTPDNEIILSLRKWRVADRRWGLRACTIKHIQTRGASSQIYKTIVKRKQEGERKQFKDGHRTGGRRTR